jgi:hypothetical protein
MTNIAADQKSLWFLTLKILASFAPADVARAMQERTDRVLRDDGILEGGGSGHHDRTITVW